MNCTGHAVVCSHKLGDDNWKGWKTVEMGQLWHGPILSRT
jgi:hypothetical protein